MNIIHLPEGFDGAGLIADLFAIAGKPLSICVLFLAGYYVFRLIRR